jgi:hypothetical protein
MFDDPRRCGLQDHIPSDRGDTGRHETSGFFIFHQTHAAGPIWLEIRMMAESGNFYAVLFGCLQDARFGRTGDFLAVNGQRDGFQKIGSFVK